MGRIFRKTFPISLLLVFVGSGPPNDLRPDDPGDPTPDRIRFVSSWSGSTGGRGESKASRRQSSDATDIGQTTDVTAASFHRRSRCTLAIAVVLSRVFDYYSSKFCSIQVLVSFHFRLQISIQVPVAAFLQSFDELLEFMETWGIAISFATCQPVNRV